MIKLRIQPRGLAVTGAAVIAQLSLMRFVFAMAGDTGDGRFTKFLSRLMAVTAAQYRVCILQGKLSEFMIELFRHQLDDIGIAALVFRVTAMTLHLRQCGELAVISLVGAG